MRILVLVLPLLVACGGDTLEETDPTLFEEVPSYSEHVAPLLERHCLACHDGRGGATEDLELQTCATAFDNRVRAACRAAEQELIDRFASNLIIDGSTCWDVGAQQKFEPFSMPDGGKVRMTRAEQLIIVRWAVAGSCDQ